MSAPSPAFPASPPPVEDDDVSHIKSIFDPATLVKRGYCAVSTGKERAAEGHKVYYELHGEDKPTSKRLVFIMGLSNSAFAWHNQLPFFARLPGYSVLVFDNLGVGHSTSPSHALSAALTRYKTSEMARDVVELLEYLGWVERGEVVVEGKGKGREGEGLGKTEGWRRQLHVVGISMGGMIAQELALLLPASLLSLTLTSTHSGAPFYAPSLPSRKATSMIMKQMAGLVKTPEQQIGEIVSVLFPEGFLEEREEDGRTRRERLNAEFLHRYHLNRRQPLSGRMGQTFAALSHHVPAAKLASIGENVPRVAVVHGEEDEMIHVSKGKALHEGIPNSTLLLIPTGGHALPSQITDQYNDWVRGVVEEAEAMEDARLGVR
ncbi:hypothetical protein JCM6882_007430 [Rhodosporidiobolus microsporus]